MKTAQELRGIASTVEPGMNLAERINLICQDQAERGKVSYVYLVHNDDYTSKDIDFAVSELVAKGFSVEFLTDGIVPTFTELKITW